MYQRRQAARQRGRQEAVRRTEWNIDRRVKKTERRGGRRGECAETEEVTYAHFHRHKPWLNWVRGSWPLFSCMRACVCVCAHAGESVSPVILSAVPWAVAEQTQSTPTHLSAPPSSPPLPTPTLHCQARSRHRPLLSSGLRETQRERKRRMKCLRKVLQSVGYVRERLQEMHCVRKCVVVCVCGHMFRCALERIKSLCGMNASVWKTEAFTCACVVCMRFLCGWHVSGTGVFFCVF